MKLERVVIITGLSGSGKSSAARALEDEGFFVVDNLPLAMLPAFLQLAEGGIRFTRNVAVVIDVRNRDFLAGLEETIGALSKQDFLLDIIFFESSDATLIRRYSETRRRHPLADKNNISAALNEERALLSGLREIATRVFDTSGLTPHQLRLQIIHMIKGEDAALPMMVRLQSFGYRYGVPIESDLVMDVRFLPNPHFDPELKPLTGLNRRVREFVIGKQPCQAFLEHFYGLLGFLLPQYRQEGKSYLTISIGCTGGRHRSVSIVEEMRSYMAEKNVSLDVIHRDIDKV